MSLPQGTIFGYPWRIVIAGPWGDVDVHDAFRQTAQGTQPHHVVTVDTDRILAAIDKAAKESRRCVACTCCRGWYER